MLISRLKLNLAGSLNGDAGADSTDSKKIWIFKSFSRITPQKMKILQTNLFSAKLDNTLSN